MNLISQTWPWYISGFIIGLVMLCLIYFGKNFGMSTNLKSLCAMTGVGKKVGFFDFDWKSQRWNFIVVLGAMVGGFVAVHFMSDPTNVSISQINCTIRKLRNRRSKRKIIAKCSF
jgi:uncharacterized protein